MILRIIMIIFVLAPLTPVGAQDDYNPILYAIRINQATYLREGPGVDHAIIATVPPDTQLEVNGESADWLHVHHDSQDAWMANWLKHTVLAPLTKFAHLPECTPEEYLEFAASSAGFDIMRHFDMSVAAHARRGTLSADTYITYRNAVWSLAPPCSPLFEFVLWKTLLYAELLTLNFQESVAPEAFDDPRVAALRADYDLHPSVAVTSDIYVFLEKYLPDVLAASTQ